MADDPQPDSNRLPKYLPLTEETFLARLTSAGVRDANEVLRPVLFGDRQPPWPWSVKAVLIEIEREGKRYEITYVGERWAGFPPRKKADPVLLKNLSDKYAGLDPVGKEGANTLFRALTGLTFEQLVHQSQDERDSTTNTTSTQEKESAPNDDTDTPRN